MQVLMIVVDVVLSGIVSYLVARKYNDVAAVRVARKYQQYEKIIDWLVNMKGLLGSLVRSYEWAIEKVDAWELEGMGAGEEEYAEFDRFQEQVERVLTGGDYIISKKALNALSELKETLSRTYLPSPGIGSAVTLDEAAKDLRRVRSLLSGVESCLEVVSAEAKGV